MRELVRTLLAHLPHERDFSIATILAYYEIGINTPGFTQLQTGLRNLLNNEGPEAEKRSGTAKVWQGKTLATFHTRGKMPHSVTHIDIVGALARREWTSAGIFFRPEVKEPKPLPFKNFSFVALFLACVFLIWSLGGKYGVAQAGLPVYRVTNVKQANNGTETAAASHPYTQPVKEKVPKW